MILSSMTINNCDNTMATITGDDDDDEDCLLLVIRDDR